LNSPVKIIEKVIVVDEKKSEKDDIGEVIQIKKKSSLMKGKYFEQKRITLSDEEISSEDEI